MVSRGRQVVKLLKYAHLVRQVLGWLSVSPDVAQTWLDERVLMQSTQVPEGKLL